MKITIKVFEDGKEILSKVFDEGVYRAGRSDFSDLCLPSDSVSRSHLELRVTDSAVYMTNMSTGGKVRVNGRAVETAELQDGDELSVGPYRMRIYHGEQEQAAVSDNPLGADLGDAAPQAEGGEAGGGGFGEMPQEPGMGEAFPEPERAPAGEEAGGGEPGFAEPAPSMAMPMLEAEGNLPVEGTAALARAETQIEMRPVVAKLMFTEGPRAGEEFFLEAYEVTFGRSKKADIFLDDDKLSRVHAKITRVGMGYRLIDLNSRNGTYVNGMRVLEHPLSSFDVIEIGNTKIKFIIHDIVAGEMNRNVERGQATVAIATPIEETKSLQLDPAEQAVILELQRPPGGAPPTNYTPGFSQQSPAPYIGEPPKSKLKYVLLAVAAAGVVYLLYPTPPTTPSKPVKGTSAAIEPGTGVTKPPVEIKVPPSMPKEYAELSPEQQRAIEGHYNSAIQAAEKDQYEEAVGHLRKIHESLPYYKQSRELLDQFMKKLKDKQIADAQQKAKSDEKQDLQIYLEEGMEYLKEGDFERAAESFNSAIVIDPSNQTAIKGLKAAEYKVRSIEQIPAERDPEQDKRKLVADLFQKAVAAFTNKSYQEAIDTADKIRQIELKGDTQYLNEAKQIIDRARMLQKEEFEPFLIQAKEKYAEGDYNASRDLCEEMLKRDNAYEEAKECVLKAKKQLNRLAKEAYTHGYILESMNRIEEAKQYWNRAKNYTRQGDEYFDKVNKKLDYYQ